jgi:hypothetical protein
MNTVETQRRFSFSFMEFNFIVYFCFCYLLGSLLFFAFSSRGILRARINFYYFLAFFLYYVWGMAKKN